MAEKLRISSPTRRRDRPPHAALMMIYETTSKVVDDRASPSSPPRSAEILLGVLGRRPAPLPAHRRLRLPLPLQPPAPAHRQNLYKSLPRVDASRISKRINKLLDRTGEPATEPLHQITTLEDALERLAYIMGQGDGARILALHPAEDIFPSSTPTLLFSKPVEGSSRTPTGSR
ncbi:MAG: hypothetical protein R3F60_28315 [bacterium]